MLIPHLNEAALRKHATHKSFDRGTDYYQQGAVIEISQRGNCIHAEVGGNESMSYFINLEFNDKSITTADCTCPYDYSGWCKHLVAVGLTCLHKPESIPALPTLDQQLDRLDYEEIRVLVQELVETRSDLLSEVDRFVNSSMNLASVQITTHYQPNSVTTVATAPYRNKTWQMMIDAAYYWEGEWGEEDPFDVDLPKILAEVQALIDRGEIENAQAVLMVITKTIAREWYRVDEHGGESYLIVNQLDPMWANIIFLSELSPEAVVDLQVELEECQDVWGDVLELTNSALLQKC
jgi:uncharacterized Zn finger protein